MNKLGKNSEISGMSVTNVSTKKDTAKNGRLALLTSPMETLPILEETKRQTPTGGVVSPMIKLRTAITAKWMGSTSTAIATFNKIGNNTNKAATVSIKVPTKIKSRLMSRRTMYLF